MRWQARKETDRCFRRHRNRKAEYVNNLESEIARLQHLDAMINTEKTVLMHQNQAIKEFLASQSLDVQLESMDLSTSSVLNEDLPLLCNASVDIRFDPEIGQERTFLDFDEDMLDSIWTSTDASLSEEQPPTQRPARHAPVKGDSWAALDFILALEWPCQAHVHHHGINPQAATPKACEVGGFHGHSMTGMNMVYNSAMSPTPELLSNTKATISGDTAKKWQLPHSEIDK